MLEVVNFMHHELSVSRRIENPTSRGVALIDCWVEPGGVPLHWLVTNKTKPPLDVAINPSDGSLQGTQFVLQDEVVPQGSIYDLKCEADHMLLGAVLIFDRSSWSPGSRYLEEDLLVTVAWVPDRDLCIVWGHPPVDVAEVCQVDEKLRLFFDASSCFVGYCLCYLTEDEKRVIARAE